MSLFSRPLLPTLLRKTAGSAAAWGLLATAIRVLSGLAVLPLMVRLLPSDQIGLWYVFLSLQGLAALFDLGFAPAATRATGYLWAGASELKHFGLSTISTTGDSSGPNYKLLNELIATMRLFYRLFGAVTAIIMLLGGGAWIWHKTANLPDANGLRACYAVFVIGAFLNATGDLWPALLSGINGVRRAQQLLLGSVLINATAVIVGLSNHFGLWALVAGSLGSGLFLRIAGRFSFLQMLGSQYQKAAVRLQLIQRLWPTAWRSGLVSLGGYLVLSFNTLICSAFLSLEITGSYGLSMNILAILASAAALCTQIKMPLVNQLRVRHHIDQIVKLWIGRTRLSIVAYILGGAALLLFGGFGLDRIGANTKFLPPGELALALLIIGLEMHHSLYGALVISENQNPFVKPALLSGVATILLSLFLTARIGVWGMLLAQGGVQASFNNWWTVCRGIRGLGLSTAAYWRMYFQFPLRL